MLPNINRRQTVSLLLILAGLLLFLLLFAAHQEQKGVAFAGTDDLAAALIKEGGGAEKRWFSGIGEGPGDLEGPLFVLQAALGAGIVGYCLGYLQARRQEVEAKHGDN